MARPADGHGLNGLRRGHLGVPARALGPGAEKPAGGIGGVQNKASKLQTPRGHGRRRGAVIVQTVVLMTVFVGFTALSVDLGLLYDARAELQRTAASRLAAFADRDPFILVKRAAEESALSDAVLGEGVTLSEEDVIFGRAEVDPLTERCNFIPTTGRTTVRGTTGFQEGPIPLLVANVFGYSHKSLWAEAAARLAPRDIAIVADLSGSHNDDSELRHYKIAETYSTGKAYRAEGSVEEYSAELEEILETLGGRHTVVLIQ